MVFVKYKELAPHTGPHLLDMHVKMLRSDWSESTDLFSMTLLVDVNALARVGVLSSLWEDTEESTSSFLFS